MKNSIKLAVFAGMLLGIGACAPRQYVKPEIANPSYHSVKTYADPVRELDRLCDEFEISDSTDSLDSESEFWKEVQNSLDYEAFPEPKISQGEAEKTRKELENYRKYGIKGMEGGK